MNSNTRSKLKQRIKQYVLEAKSKGLTKISDFDVMDKLHAPIEAVDAALEELEREGLLAKRPNFTGFQQ